MSEASEQELAALRATLDQKLAALEAALASPSTSESLETLVIELARVATVEAEVAATRACLDSQLDAQRQAAARAEAQQALQTERETLAALQRDLDQARTALKAERDAAALLRQERDEAAKALQAAHETTARFRQRAEDAQDTERMTSAALRRDLEDARTALNAAQQAGLELNESVEQAHATLERERAAGVELREALVTLKQQLAAANQAAEKRGTDVDAAQSLIDDLERARNESSARADALARDIEVLTSELSAARQAAGAAASRADASARAIEAARTDHERAMHEMQARIDAAGRERESLVTELTSAREAGDAARRQADERSQTFGHDRAETERALAEAEARTAAAIRDRDMMAEELEMMRENLASIQNAQIQVEQMRDAATARIADLEAELRERDRRQAERRREPAPATLGALRNVAAIESEETDHAVPAPPVTPVTGQPPAEAAAGAPDRRASRHAFHQDMQVLIDGSPATLVDLSITGAQVVSQTALKPNRMVRIQLPCDENPITCKGKVVWARLEASSTAGLRYRAGLLFTGVDERAVESFLAQREEPRG